MKTTNRIRAAATLVWLGVALANHARAGEVRDRARKDDNVANLRIDDGRLRLHVERLPLHGLIAAFEHTGLARIEVHGEAAGITVSDSFEAADVAQALRRLLSAHSHVLIERGSQDRVPRTIELILFSSGSSERSRPPDSDQVAISRAPASTAPPVDAMADAAPSSATPEEIVGDPVSGDARVPRGRLRIFAASPIQRGETP